MVQTFKLRTSEHHTAQDKPSCVEQIAVDAMATQGPAAALNNRAVAVWQAGRAQEAMQLFHAALTTLRDSCQDVSIPPTTNDSSGASAVDNMLSDELLPTLSYCHGENIEISQDLSILVCYDRPFLFHGADSCVEDLLLHAGIIFNMALLHHSKGMDHASDLFLEKASQMYDLAYGVVQNQKDTTNRAPFSLPLLNNMAHIASQLRRLDDMKSSLEALSLVFKTVMETSDHATDEEDSQIFRSNILIGQTVKFITATAA